MDASAPITLDRWCFTLHGYIRGFHEHFQRGFHERLPDALYARLRSANDTETLFMLAVHAIRNGDDPAEALFHVVEWVRESVGRADREFEAQLNMALSDGEVLAVSRASPVERTNSLYAARDPDMLGVGVVVASEAFDPDPAWAPVEPHSVLRIDGRGSVDSIPAPR